MEITRDQINNFKSVGWGEKANEKTKQNKTNL
jgi:hypothetical protein